MRFAAAVTAAGTVKAETFLAGCRACKVTEAPLAPELVAEIQQHVGLLVPFSAVNVSEITKSLRKMSGVPRFHLHLMRHNAERRIMPSNCPRAAARGGSLILSASRLGIIRAL